MSASTKRKPRKRASRWTPLRSLWTAWIEPFCDGETEGFARVHVKKGTDQILGATIVATQAGDMISQVAMAMTHRLGLKKIAATIFPYPTQAEAIRKTGDVYNRTRLTPFVKRLFAWWLSWSR